VVITCRELAALIDDQLDGALNERQRREFSDHLRICGVCKDYRGRYVDSIALLRAALLDERHAPPELDEATVVGFVKALQKSLHGKPE
jgi:predicted anti-sigma-YlaC factor YlaD